MNETDSRRPLKVRNVSIIQSIARFLSQRNITPNQISVASVFFAGFAASCFFCFEASNNLWFLIAAAVFIQCRLLCNLFDGMVAVEGGKKTKSGELFNDIPDRIADPLILISVGYVIHIPGFSYTIELGWTAGILAVATAYVRTLGASMGAPMKFQGPMAKQHRMAVITAGCLLGAIEAGIWGSHYVLFACLIIIILGCLVTTVRRTLFVYHYLES